MFNHPPLMMSQESSVKNRYLPYP